MDSSEKYIIEQLLDHDDTTNYQKQGVLGKANF
jgi:hypothetical protein